MVVFTTIVGFNEVEEVKGIQANSRMTMEATKGDVQDAIDEGLMSDF